MKTSTPANPVPFNPGQFGMLPSQKPIIASGKPKTGPVKPPVVVNQLPQSKALVVESPAGAPSIAEQARALLNNVDRIYEFIHDNIDYLPQYGMHKGGYGALIDGCGSAWDQADLMIQLLNQGGGFQTQYVVGSILLDASGPNPTWTNLTGCTDLLTAGTLFANGGFVCTIYPETNQLEIVHCWVQVTLPDGGGTWVFDPSMKTYNYTSGIDIASAMGYNRTSFLNDANQGSTFVPGQSVQNINNTNINNDLQTYSMNLANWIKTNAPGATFDEILSGRSIPSFEGEIRQTDLPYHDNTQDTYWYTTLPTSYQAQITVSYGSGTGYPTYTAYTPSLYGQRLTLWFNGSLQASIYLNGTSVAGPSPAQGSGTTNTAVISVVHPYLNPDGSHNNFADGSQSIQVTAGQQCTIGNTYGWSSEQMAAVHQQVQNQAIAAGTSSSAESLLGESLLLVWDNLGGQASRAADIISRIGNTSICLHHLIGMVVQLPASPSNLQFISSYLAAFNVSPLAAGGDYISTGFTTSLMFQKLEGCVSQQVNGIPSADTVQLITMANQQGKLIYDANTSNWNTGINISNIMSTLGYPSSAISDIQNNFIFPPTGQPTYRVAVPDVINLSVGSISSFYGYMGVSTGSYPPTSVVGKTWFAKGAVGGEYQTDAQTNSAAEGNARQVNGFGMPAVTATETAQVNMLNGRYEYSSTDLTVGNQGEPYQLSFKRSYNSALALTFQGMGFGWCHNWQINANANSDGFAGLGYQQVRASAAAIASLFVSLDVALADETMPINNIVTNCIVQQYMGSQLVNNTVRVQIGPSFLIFTKMPDGSYLPPLGLNGASLLTYNSNTSVYTYTTPEGVVYNFNSNGTINTIVYPFGITITFTYTSGNLTKVSNGFRSLNFAYDQYGQLNTINDGNGRTVTLTLPYATGNLTGVQDPVGNTTTYAYVSRGLMSQVFKPANPSSAVVNNTYDTLNRVKQQTDAYGNLWQFYFAGSRSQETAPDNSTRVLYFDALGSTTRNINALNYELDTEYDGNERPVLVTLPEGNSTATTYDANGNILTVTQYPKPGSGLEPRTHSYTYDLVWTTKVATATDAAGNTTTYTYDSHTGLLTQVQYPAPQSGMANPVVTNTYNSLGQPLVSTDPTGVQAVNNYDPTSNNLLATSVGSGGLMLKTTFGYDAIGNVTSVVDPRQNIAFAVTFTYDKNRRQTQVSQPGTPGPTALLVTTYDANGNVVKQEQQTPTDPAYQVTTTTYSIDGKPLVVLQPPINVQSGTPNPVTFTYDSMRRVQSIMDQQGTTTSYVYDLLSRITQVAQAGIPIQAVTYTENGLVATLSDAVGNTTSATYDGFDRLVITTYPKPNPDSAAPFEQLSYDVLDNVVQVLTRAGATISYTYDALNRTLTASPQGMATVTYSYDLAGRMLSYAIPVVPNDPSTGTFQLSYDAAGRMVQEQYPDGKIVGYGLDAASNLIQLFYPEGFTVSRRYDAANRLMNVSGFEASISASYDVASRLTALTNGNRTGTGYRYDKSDNLTALSIGGLQPNGIIQGSRVNFSYTVNPWNSRSLRSCSDPSFVWYPQIPSTTTYGAANPLNQYPSVDGVDYSYDQNGCLLSDGNLTYAYDTLNNLNSVQGEAVNVSYKYDPVGRLTLKTSGSTTTRYLYAGLQRIAEYDGDGNLLRRYVYGDGLDAYLFTVDAEGNVTYLYADESNSLIMTADADGLVTGTQLYDPWGQPIESLNGINIGYTGQFYEPEIGCYYYKARFYSPQLGRFLQPDPIGYSGGINLYEYCSSNPANLSDPLGLQGVTSVDPGGNVTLITGISGGGDIGGDVLDTGVGIGPQSVDDWGPPVVYYNLYALDPWLGVFGQPAYAQPTQQQPASPPPPPPPPTYLQQAVSLTRGIADYLDFGAGDKLFGYANKQGVDRNSLSYQAGEVIASVAPTGRLLYATAAKALPVLNGVKFATANLDKALAISDQRAALKVVFRLGLFAEARQITYSKLLTKYVTPDKIIQAAQRTNSFFNGLATAWYSINMARRLTH